MASPISDSIRNRDQTQIIPPNQPSTSDPEPANDESEPKPSSGLEPTDLNSESPAPSGDGGSAHQFDSEPRVPNGGDTEIEPATDESDPRNTHRRRRVSGSEPPDSNPESPAPGDGSCTRQFVAPNGGATKPEEISPSNLTELITGFIIKSIGFQINLMLWLLSKSHALVTNPIGTMREVKDHVYEEWDTITENVDSIVGDWLGENKSVWDLLGQHGWGLLWAGYVCFVLFGLVVCSFLVGGIWMHYLVEEPIRIEQALTFDYTMRSPLAFVPVTSCADVGCGTRCVETSQVRKGMGLHSGKHRFDASALLVLPESEYNRNLGMFQVRLDYLSANGAIISSSSQPCMLHFKSDPIRLFLTLLKAAPLLAGYISESQTLNLKFTSFVEGNEPTACIRVILQQRAEYPPGAGIPELYHASLILESELPPFRKFVWRWKRTVFVWISMTSLMTELLLALIFCRPIIDPRSIMGFGSDHI